MAKLLIADTSIKATEKLKSFLERDGHEVLFLIQPENLEAILL